MDIYEQILAAIEKPSRYLGTEVNSIRKDPNQVKLRIALAFPDLYEIGTSHFGMQILYHLLNRQPEIAAERVFAPAADMEALLRRSAVPLASLESRTPLNRFDMLGFSLLYELNYTNVLTMLDLAGIPLRAAERDARQPFVVAGGPCTCNPEPVAEFFDAMVVGDGEAVVLPLARAWIEWKRSGAGRESLLRRWSEIEGIYVPSFFEAGCDETGAQTLVPRFRDYGGVRRAIAPDLDAADFPERPVVPFGKPVHDRLRIEVARGCTRGCRFCQAGMLYRPVRERAPDKLFDLAVRSLGATGYEDLSLLSLSTGDYGCIVPLMQRLMGRFAAERVAVSLPSLRAGTLTPELMELIKKVRKTGFTIAPEAGSQRLRDVINKNINEAEIVATVRDAFEMGWQLIKIYFMIGLPTETEEDLTALVALVQKLRKLKGPAGRRGRINVSVAAYIPKPHTPFQWEPQIGLPEARARLDWLKDRLRLPGVEFKWQNPEMSLLEGVFARGDRRLARALIAAYRRGCRFDGWGDKLDFDAWIQAFAETGVDPAFFTTRPREPGEPLPWDHIDTRVAKAFLLGERGKGLAGVLTPDCRDGDCQGCEACDFRAIAPRIHRPDAAAGPAKEARGARPVFYRKLMLFYEKLGPARFFGHLELVNLFLRALRRAAIEVKFSEGFHPKPKVSFDNPLPTGVESEEERLVLSVPHDLQPAELVERLNAELPNGLRITGCSDELRESADRHTYRVCFHPPLPESLPGSTGAIDMDRELEVASPKGKLKKIALKDILRDIRISAPGCIEMTLGCEPGRAVRPSVVLEQVFGIPVQTVNQARIRKLKSLARTPDQGGLNPPRPRG